MSDYSAVNKRAKQIVKFACKDGTSYPGSSKALRDAARDVKYAWNSYMLICNEGVRWLAWTIAESQIPTPYGTWPKRDFARKRFVEDKNLPKMPERKRGGVKIV